MEAHCRRCDTLVEGAYPNPRARRWAKAYALLWIPIIPILPIMASDYVVSLPLLMGYMIGFGPIYRIIAEPPTCSICGAYVEPVLAGSARGADTGPG